MNKANYFLFVSIDGMTDPLGQSQVLPYLVGLAKKGYSIGIVSCEKKANWEQNHTQINNITKAANIKWEYSFYKNSIPFVSQIQNYNSLKKIVKQTIINSPNQIILHCRSYLAGLIGLIAKKKYSTGLIFDMRGFWADERIDGGIWNKSKPIGRFLYYFFKKKEKEILLNADAIISLTQKAKSIILNWELGINNSKISVIPCCVDLEHFSEKTINNNLLITIKTNYPQLNNKFVLSYVGSLGTWYMSEEMITFFKILSQKTDAVFLIITKDDKEIIYEAAKKQGVALDKLIIIPSSRNDMPTYISLSSASLFFIKPSFSKSASSPTKMGELLSMGIPIITNTGIGDVESIINESQCGILISDFNDRSYQNATNELLERNQVISKNTKHTAHNYFSLLDGIEKYNHVYSLFNNK